MFSDGSIDSQGIFSVSFCLEGMLSNPVRAFMLNISMHQFSHPRFSLMLYSVPTVHVYDSAELVPRSPQTNRADNLAASDLRKDILKLEGISSDITLICDGENFPAHKTILGARSDVFSAMFQHSCTLETETKQVEIADTDARTVKRFLQ